MTHFTPWVTNVISSMGLKIKIFDKNLTRVCVAIIYKVLLVSQKLVFSWWFHNENTKKLAHFTPHHPNKQNRLQEHWKDYPFRSWAILVVWSCFKWIPWLGLPRRVLTRYPQGRWLRPNPRPITPAPGSRFPRQVLFKIPQTLISPGRFPRVRPADSPRGIAEISSPLWKVKSFSHVGISDSSPQIDWD